MNGRPSRATVVADAAELDRLWPLADQRFPPCARHRARAAEVGRTIPVLGLSPAG